MAAPVKAPLACPNNSLPMTFEPIDAKSTGTNGSDFRLPQAWTARANSSLAGAALTSNQERSIAVPDASCEATDFLHLRSLSYKIVEWVRGGNALGGLRRMPHAPQATGPDDPIPQYVRIDGFLQEVIRTGAHCTYRIVDRTVTGENDDLGCGTAMFDFRQHVMPAHARHAEIDDCDRKSGRGRGSQSRDCLESVGCKNDFAIPPSQCAVGERSASANRRRRQAP